MLIKYTGKYVNIYFIMKITFSVHFSNFNEFLKKKINGIKYAP